MVRDNIFAFSEAAQVVRSREDNHPSFTFERNIVQFNNRWLLGGTWLNGQYLLDRNLCWDDGGSAFDFACRTFVDWKAAGQDRSSVIADPAFVSGRREQEEQREHVFQHRRCSTCALGLFERADGESPTNTFFRSGRSEEGRTTLELWEARDHASVEPTGRPPR